MIRWYMPVHDRVHSARATHVHSAFVQAPLLSGNFELAKRNVVH